MGLDAGQGSGLSIPGGASLIPPGASFFEDDFPYSTNGTTYSRWSVTQANGTATAVAGTSNQQGVLQLMANAVAASRYAISRGLGQFIIPPSWFWQFNVGFSLPVLSVPGAAYTVRAGLMDSAAAAPNNGVWFEYTDSVFAGQWQLVTANGGVVTRVASNVFATAGKVSLRGTGFNNLQAIYNINGNTVGAITTNIPVGVALGLVVGIFNTDAVQHVLNLDYAALYYNVTR
jgi:hypothetical protein